MYNILCAELKNDPLNCGYSQMNPEQILLSLSATNRKKVISRFASFRTIAALLTAEEYATFKGMLSQLSVNNPVVTDMLKMMELPGDECGGGGGIDFGTSGVRDMLDYCIVFNPSYETLINKLKVYTEVYISRLEELELDNIEINHIISALKINKENA